MGLLLVIVAGSAFLGFVLGRRWAALVPLALAAAIVAGLAATGDLADPHEDAPGGVAGLWAALGALGGASALAGAWMRQAAAKQRALRAEGDRRHVATDDEATHRHPPDQAG